MGQTGPLQAQEDVPTRGDRRARRAGVSIGRRLITATSPMPARFDTRRGWLGRSAPQGVELPGPFDTFELVLAPVGKLVVPSEQHVANGRGNKDLSEAGCLFDPRR